ncbi:MAG: T9SS type A sorting domain-containing protein [Bacteroidia bacterium]|nr:T9SS type A sorting domain-containing protein [Bacteroidia bacterium]
MKCFFSLTIALYAACFSQLSAQDFMLQGWYWDYPKTAQGAMWADTMANRAAEWGKAGFNMIWCPPMSMAASGNGSNGYDIKDLFNVGGGGISSNTGFGNKARIQNMMQAFSKHNLIAVGDMIYNHRDGGSLQDNPAVAGWIKNYNLTKHNNGDVCYPSDRFRSYINIGGNTGRGAGTYYFRVRSASQSNSYFGKPYRFVVRSLKINSNASGPMNETANNGGGLCAQGNDSVALGRTVIASIDNGGCGIDEFKLVLDTSMFYNASDRLTITLANDNGDYSDHFLYSVYYDANGAELKDTVMYQTSTNWANMQSSRGQMDYTYFKPNGNPTCLCGDWDGMLFFYDYDHSETKTRDTLFAYTKWMWDSIGVKGFRVDAVKNFAPLFAAQTINYLHSNGYIPSVYVGEFYDYNPQSLKSWVDNVKAAMTPAAQQTINPRLFDFALQGSLKEACDNTGYDVRNVFNNGMVDGAGASGFNVVSFVNNHDFRNTSQSCDVDPLLAYAYILTNNAVGLPCVYYPDYYLNAGSYKKAIDDLMDVHKKFIHNTSFREYLNRFNTPFASNFIQGNSDKSLIYQLSGGGSASCIANKDVIVAINFGNTTLKVDHQINTGNPFHSNVGDTLNDLFGNSNFPYAIVNGNAQIYIELPPRSYSVWANVPAPSTPIISVTGNSTICKGDTVYLSTTSHACNTIQWYHNGQPLPGQNQTNLPVTQQGIYTVELSYYGNNAKTSAGVNIVVNPQPVIITASSGVLSAPLGGSYQWWFSPNGNSFTSIPAANAVSYQATATGFYYVHFTDANGCSDTSNHLYVGFTGIAQNTYNTITLTPNPSTQIITLTNLSAKSITQVTIYNTLGVEVIHHLIQEKTENVLLNIAQLPAGIYFVKVKKGGKQTLLSFIKN